MTIHGVDVASKVRALGPLLPLFGVFIGAWLVGRYNRQMARDRAEFERAQRRRDQREQHLFALQDLVRRVIGLAADSSSGRIVLGRNRVSWLLSWAFTPIGLSPLQRFAKATELRYIWLDFSILAARVADEQIDDIMNDLRDSIAQYESTTTRDAAWDKFDDVAKGFRDLNNRVRELLQEID